MNVSTRRSVAAILNGKVPFGEEDSILKQIVKVVDDDMSDVLIRTMEFGEILEAFGLHIVAKEDS